MQRITQAGTHGGRFIYWVFTLTRECLPLLRDAIGEGRKEGKTYLNLLPFSTLTNPLPLEAIEYGHDR